MVRYVLPSCQNKRTVNSLEHYKDRVNNEPADVLGNFVNRVGSFKKYHEYSVPKAPSTSDSDVDKQLMTFLRTHLIADLVCVTAVKLS